MSNEISLDQDRIIDALVEQEEYSFFGAKGKKRVTLQDEVGLYVYENHGDDLQYIAELLVRIDCLEVPALKKKAEADLAKAVCKITGLARERLIAVAKRIAEENS
jgi:hypothetical protein